MSPKTTPTKAPSRRRPSPRWVAIPAVLSLAIALGMAWYLRREPVRDLSYGQFRKALAQGQVRSVKVGASQLTGELAAGSPDARPAAFRTARAGLERDDQLVAMLEKYLPDGNYESETPGMAETAALPALLLVVMALSVFVIVKRGGMGSAMAFTRSKHRLYGKHDLAVSFEDVAGIDEAVAELREVSDFLKTPEKYHALGGKVPKGVLLVGPPGTGKTLLARAVAGEAGVPFFSLSGSDFMEMYVGVGAARVRSLFAQAQAKAPCLVFIDELDALGKARGAGGPGNDEREQTLNQLLVAMDGFDANRGIIVLAATNRPETLDPALVRPGRFDRQVVVDRPDIGGRERILRVHVRNVPIGGEIDLRQIAAMTPGFVGAELANLVNEAALLAARKGKPAVDRHDFEEGVERIIAGPEKAQRVSRRDEQRRIAVHEAGHALVARSLTGTDPVHKVSIVGRGNGMGGYTMYRPEDDRFLHTQSWLLNTIRCLMGGTVAEEITFGEASDGATSDLQRATQIARKMVTEFGMSPTLGRVSYQNEGRSPFLPGGGANDASWSEQTAREIDLEVRRILDESLAAAREILDRRRGALDAIADLLMERETIDAADLQAVLERHSG